MGLLKYKSITNCTNCQSELYFRNFSSNGFRLYCTNCKKYFKTDKKNKLPLEETENETKYNNFMELMFNLRGSPKIFMKTFDYLSQSSSIKMFRNILIHQKPIKSIRYFFHVTKNENDCTEKTYPFDNYIFNIDSIGHQIVNLLNNYHFISGRHDSIVINLTPDYENDKLLIKEKNNAYNTLSIDYGLDPNKIKHLNDLETLNLVKTITFNILKDVYKSNEEKLNIILQAEIQFKLDDYKSHTNTFMESENEDHFIRISYNLIKNSHYINLYLYYKNKINKFERELIYLELMKLEDLSLIDSITLDSEEFIINPKNKTLAQYNHFNINKMFNKN